MLLVHENRERLPLDPGLLLVDLRRAVRRTASHHDGRLFVRSEVAAQVQRPAGERSLKSVTLAYAAAFGRSWPPLRLALSEI
jgi:hypothetical protein